MGIPSSYGWRARYEGRKSLRLIRKRAGALGALTAAISLVTLGLVTPAQAALSGSDWIMKTLPARYSIGTAGPAVSPVSCVPGTKFCVAIVPDTKNLVDGSIVGQAALVTRNAGRTWTGHVMPTSLYVLAVSCATTKVCWATGTSWATGGPDVVETTDGGGKWADVTPAAWANDQWWANAIDCVSATTCWLAGTAGNLQNPAVAETADGGASWTTFTNLPTFVSNNPNGTYTLNGISCVSADSCVAVGGLNEAGGTAQAISTADGGATWDRSAAPVLSGVQQMFGVSCLPDAGGTTTCFGVGDISVSADSSESVALVSHDGGATWGQAGTFNDGGWLQSVSCASTQNCWAAGAASTDALLGTSDAGSSWSQVTSDTTNEDGSVSCLNIDVCVATTDNALWVTSDDGGLTPAG
jgi:hypothetical protein